MRRTHYLRERGKLDGRAKELREELENVERKIAALDVVWNEIFNEIADAPAPDLVSIKQGEQEVQDSENSTDAFGRPIAKQPTQEASASNGAASRLIESAVSDISLDFGVKEIESRIVSAHPDAIVDRTTIAGKLKKMTEEGRLELMVQGRGRRPSIFRKIAVGIVPTNEGKP